MEITTNVEDGVLSLKGDQQYERPCGKILNSAWTLLEVKKKLLMRCIYLVLEIVNSAEPPRHPSQYHV